VELGNGPAPGAGLAERIRARLREALTFTSEIELVPFGSLPRSSYKSHLVDWSGATPPLPESGD
jgi:phenylacetate-CoA ligase